MRIYQNGFSFSHSTAHLLLEFRFWILIGVFRPPYSLLWSPKILKRDYKQTLSHIKDFFCGAACTV